ncbi:MAG: ABC transporter permease subunit [Bdellovibrionaceae bacterium]|nr:ABC transporter permease subunit [Pseudobdellovibrionaceae bacterium]
MNGVLTITWKEMKGFMMRPAFYVICFFLTLLFSYSFSISLFQFVQMAGAMGMHPGMGGGQQQANIHYMVFLKQLSMLNLLMIFAVPALTMKLFSEEKKMHTFDLLLTAPVTSFQIVLGKFLAAALAILFIVFLSMIYPLSTALFVENMKWGPLLISYLGLFLVGLVYVAMNLFCSSLTESILISFFMSVILNVSLWFIGMGVEIVDSQTARQVFEHISLNSHLSGLVEGTIRSQGIVFIMSAVGLFLFLCERIVESHRWRSS